MNSMKKTRLLTFPCLFVLISFLCCATAQAQNTFEDLSGRFAVDLPEDWKLQPQTNEYVYIFTGAGTEQIILVYQPEETSREKLFATAVDNMKSSVSNAAPEGQVMDLEVNGNPARWGIHRGTLQTQGVTVTLYGLLGGIALDEGGLAFISFLNDTSRAAWEPKIKKVFHSIREVDTEVTGASEATEVVSGAMSPEAAQPAAPSQPTPFEDKYLQATLPAGWTSKPVTDQQRKDDGVIAKFSSKGGANVVCGCFNLLKTWITPKKNEKKLYREGHRTILTAIPNAETIEGPLEFKNQDGKKITVQTYKGFLIAEGKEISMHAIQASGKTKRCKQGLTLYGFVSSSIAATAVPQMMEIIRSIR